MVRELLPKEVNININNNLGINLENRDTYVRKPIHSNVL